MKHDFISLYNQCFDDVYRYIYFKTNNKWDTDDIVSDIFRKAYEKFNDTMHNPRAWLFTIAKNSITDFYRRKKPIPLGDDIYGLSITDDIENTLEKKDMIGLLKQSLLSLPEDELEIITLKFFSNMKYREISQVTGKDQGFLRTKSNRIIKKLRAMINKYLEDMI